MHNWLVFWIDVTKVSQGEQKTILGLKKENPRSDLMNGEYFYFYFSG